MRKNEYIGGVRVRGLNVCGKPNTICSREGARARCMWKSEYNGQREGEWSGCM